jgi:serine/threonine protein kinase
VTEVITLTNLNHPHIIKVIGHCWAPQICMVLEYMPKGTLHDMLTYKALQLSWESPLLDVAQQMASAVAYLHSMRPPIVHRDIKTRNILMRDFRTCKLADFGLSVLSKADSRAGTVRYVAPEVAAYGESTVRSDVWSLGVCFWEMATRARFPGLRAAQRLPRRLPYSIPVAMRAVAFGCLSHDPATRLSAHDTEACLEEILRRIASLEYIPNEAPAAPAVAAAAAATDDDASSLAPYYQLDHSRLVVADLSQSQEVSQWYQDRLWNGEQLPAPPAPAPPPAVVASTLGRLMALDNHAREAERRASVPGIISPRFRGLQPHAAAATTVGGFAKLEAVPESPLNEAAESLSAPSTASPPPPATNPALSSSSSSQSSSIAPSSSVASVLTAAAADTFHPLPSTDSLVGPVAKAARPPLSSMLQRLAAADAMSRGETKLGTDQFLPVAAAAVAASTAAAAAAASTARSGLLQRLAAADAQSKAPPPAPAPAALPQIARAPQGLLQRLAAADAQSRGEQPPKPASEAPTSRDV